MSDEKAEPSGGAASPNNNAPIARPEDSLTAPVVLNNTRKRTPEEYTRNFDLNEISPLNSTANGNDKSEVNQNAGRLMLLGQKNGASPVAVNVVDGTFAEGTKNERRRFRGTYDDFLAKLDLSEKARLPFLALVILCVLLLVVVVVLAALWPRIPDYMSAEICVDKECLDASAQILLWANTSVSACDRPYEWACGRFEGAHAQQHTVHGVAGGEWTVQANAEYEELLEIHSFVAQLPTSVPSSAQLMLTRLHSDCMRMDSIDKSQADFALGKAIRSLSEWVYGKDWVPNAWDFRQAMIAAHSRYGLSPFFKVSMRNRNSAPFGNIITVSEGSLGLPHKMFYNLPPNHRIISAYKMLLRDFAINFGTVAEIAKKFADEMFYFEKRIVNAPTTTERHNVILTLGEVHKLAPTLPIFETITMTFSNTKLDEQTPIWIEDVAMLKEMSIIVSTTDVAPLNSFLVWSLSRHYMPFMSADYRAALEEFESVLYGYKSTPPAWYFCAKLLRDWVPFAVDALRFNPELIVTQKPSPNMFDTGSTNAAASQHDQQPLYSDRLVRDRIDNDRELVRLMFAHLRRQMQRAVDENVAIDQEATSYIIEQLTTLNLHIGLPEDIVRSSAFVNTYFADFLWRKLNFIDHLESRWTFSKKKMEEQLVSHNESEKIVAQLYPTQIELADRKVLAQYSIDLNAIVVSEQAVHKPYFHHKYPISMNFARIGVQLSRSLLDAVFAMGDQFAYRQAARRNTTKAAFSLGDMSCLENKTLDAHTPSPVRQHLALDLEATRFAAKSFTEFEHQLKLNRPVPDAGLPDLLTYDELGLRAHRRQAGLRSLDHSELFALALMQTHCGHSQSGYEALKPFVEARLAETELFHIAWDQVSDLSNFARCTTPSSPAKRCDSVL